MDEEYGAGASDSIPEDANDRWESMKVALHSQSVLNTSRLSSKRKPSRRMPTGTVISKPGLRAAGAVDRRLWVTAWLDQGQPRTALMNWVEQKCRFSAVQMPSVLATVVQYIINQCDGTVGSVDVTYRGCTTPCAFDTACAGMQSAGSLLPHLTDA